MQDMLVQFLTPQAIILSLVIWAAVLFQRKIIELSFPKIINNKFWRGLWLPICPLLFGGLLARFLSSYPLIGIDGNNSTRTMFGIVCGLFSGHIYKIANDLISNEEKNSNITNEPSIKI